MHLPVLWRPVMQLMQQPVVLRHMVVHLAVPLLLQLLLSQPRVHWPVGVLHCRQHRIPAPAATADPLQVGS